MRLLRSWRVAVVAAGLVVCATASPATAVEDFTLTGTVGGLYPGFQGTLPVTVTNPFEVAIRVTLVGGEAVTTDAGAGCTASLVTLTSVDTSIVLAPAATAGVPLVVQLDATAPDACQGAIFTIAFHGIAEADDLALPPLGAPEPLAFTGLDARELVVVGIALAALGAFLLSRRSRFTR